MYSIEVMKNNLRKIRIIKGISQKQLSEMTKIGQPTISNIETEKYTPKVDTALALADALKCSVEDLFKKER